MTRPLRRGLAALCLCLGVGAVGAQTVQPQTVINFNDLGPQPIGIHLPDGYAGFDWALKYYAMSTAAAPQNTYVAMDSNTATWIRRVDSAAFYFDGADFFSRRGLDAAGDFYIVMYLKGKTVYNGLTAKNGRLRFTGVPTLLKPDYSGAVDMIALAFDGNGKTWNHLAFDNFRYRLIRP